MKPITREPIFQKFTDQEWAWILREIPADGPGDKFRNFVEWSLFLYTHNRYHHSEIGHIQIGDEILVEEGKAVSCDKVQWYEYDLEAGHRRLARAAREMIEAYEPMLHPKWDSGWGEKTVQEMEALFDQLWSIVEHSEQAAASFEKQ
jgi:hypothetical protein